jgi:hypothetical protein
MIPIRYLIQTTAISPANYAAPLRLTYAICIA